MFCYFPVGRGGSQSGFAGSGHWTGPAAPQIEGKLANSLEKKKNDQRVPFLLPSCQQEKKQKPSTSLLGLSLLRVARLSFSGSSFFLSLDRSLTHTHTGTQTGKFLARNSQSKSKFSHVSRNSPRVQPGPEVANGGRHRTGA